MEVQGLKIQESSQVDTKTVFLSETIILHYLQLDFSQIMIVCCCYYDN